MWFLRLQMSIQIDANPPIPGCVGIAITWTCVLCSVAVLCHLFQSVDSLLEHGSSTLQNAANWRFVENTIMYHAKLMLHESDHSQNSYLDQADLSRAVGRRLASKPWSASILWAIFAETALFVLALSPSHQKLRNMYLTWCTSLRYSRLCLPQSRTSAWKENSSDFEPDAVHLAHVWLLIGW